MKINPITKELFTDEGTMIKRLHCPYNVRWDALESIHNIDTVKKCSICNHEILDTASLNDADIYRIVTNNPNTCLKVDLNQYNIRIIVK